MSKRMIVIFLTGALLMTFAAGCNLPGQAAPTVFAFPTPDLTLTAIFSVLATPTAPPPPVQTATSVVLPTEPAILTPTLIVPTNTPAPSATTAPSSTPAPTHTPVPTIVIPTSRSGPKVVAGYMSHAPKIDGSLGEWDSSQYDVNKVVYGKDNWDGEDDLSGYFMIGWDEDYLYVAAHVLDEEYVQNATGENIYKGDSLEILFDRELQADYYYNQLSPDDFQLGISPGSPDPGEDPEAYLWFPTSIEGHKSKVKIGAEKTNHGYNVEAAIPWSVLETTPKAGRHYGFTFSISDNDRASRNEQQTLISNTATRSLVDPTTWGDLQLED